MTRPPAEIPAALGAEAARDEPCIGGIVACLCGFTGTASELDDHFLHVLDAGDMNGRDHPAHHLASQDVAPAGSP